MIIAVEDRTIKRRNGFLVVEGVNGAGKGTVLNHLKETLAVKHPDTVYTREPGGTALGTELRALLLENRTLQIPSLSELLLMAADRAAHVAQVIAPALAAGKLVISDRYLYSTIAFQGYGRGVSLDAVEHVNSIAVQNVLPDLVILLDLDPTLGLARATQRQLTTPGTTQDSFEQEDIDFHERIRSGFLEIAKNRPEPFVIIDATERLENVIGKIDQILERYL